MGLLTVLGLDPGASKATAAVSSAPPVQRAGDGATGATGTPGTGTVGSTTKIAQPTAPATDQPPAVTLDAPAQAQGAPVMAGPEAKAYADEKKAVKVLFDALGTHPQANQVAGELAKVTTRLASAEGHAAKSAWTKAMAELAAARTLCVNAKTVADDWQTYRTARAVAAGMGTAVQGLNDALAGQVAALVTQADGLMAASPPNLTAALAKLAAVDPLAKAQFTGYVSTIRSVLKKVKAMPAEAQTFFATEIARGETIVAGLDAALAAKAWSQVAMLWREGWDVLGSVTRHGQRRMNYVAQRTTAAADVASVKALPGMAARGPGLDQALTAADALAGHATMKMEAGIQMLKQLSALCTALKAAAPLATTCTSLHQQADKDLAALELGPAAPALAAPLKAIRALLTTADAAEKKAATSANPAADWSAALQFVMQARADLATTKASADQMGPALGAQAAAGGNADAIGKALTALKLDIAGARSSPEAPSAKAPLDRAAAEATAVDQALAAKQTKAAGAALARAGQALGEARTLLGLHAQYAVMLQTLETNVTQLKALKTATAIGARIADVEKRIADAKALDTKHDGTGAIAALRQASEAVRAAQQADRDRTAFDQFGASIGKRLPEVTDAKAKKAVGDAIVAAGKLAEAFKFADAMTALKQVLVRIDDLKLQAGMAQNPPAADLGDTVRAMLANGGAASVDQAIQSSPAGKPAVITALASARYGKAFSFEGSAPGAEEVKSMKRCCEVWATIADDIVDNPSIKDFSHVDAVNSAGGGYTGSTGHIGMSGRVGIPQRFGNDEEHHDPKTNANVKALPATIDPDCRPVQPKGKKKDEEYLGFAAAHEVGHGVDDLRGFMAKNKGQEKYGGWIDHAGNVQPIADAIGAKIAADHASSTFHGDAESKQYVLARLQNGPAERPSRSIVGSIDFDQAVADAYDAFDVWHALATAPDVYRRQGDCDRIKIGNRIYHEAYPRAWVSYLASARSKGLTGYQFRAPAEWFAELYAGWKSGRLGPKHPALDWLTKL